MKRLIIVATLALILLMSGNVFAWTISGSFDWFVKSISDYRNDDPYGQIFMNFNTDLKDAYGNPTPKYHMAEDWNRRNGDDYGDPLYAIGDGFVKDVQDPGSGKIGKSLIVRYTLPDGSQVDSVYWHVQYIYVIVGMNVQKGDKIATIGNANGKYAPHLHWEMRKGTAGLALPWNTDSYMNPLTVGTNGAAKNYTSPSLFIDDRRVSDVHGLSVGNWTYFTMGFNAPSSTAYVEYNNGRYSLKRAVDNGLIWQYVYVQISGTWYYYPDITKVLFEAGNTYAIYGFVPNANLFVLIPGHNYKDDRAKIDMIRAVSGNSYFKSVKTETFMDAGSDSSFDYRKMIFTYNNGSGDQSVYAYQATLRSNPIIRYTTYYNPATASWTPWIAVDPNVLY